MRGCDWGAFRDVKTVLAALGHRSLLVFRQVCIFGQGAFSYGVGVGLRSDTFNEIS